MLELPCLTGVAALHHSRPANPHVYPTLYHLSELAAGGVHYRDR